MANSAAQVEALRRLGTTMDEWSADLGSRLAEVGSVSPPIALAIDAAVLSARDVEQRQRRSSAQVIAVAQQFRSADQRRGERLLRERMNHVRVAFERDKEDLSGKAAARAAAIVATSTGLLALNAKGDGRVVEAIGDLASADYIAVFIPGMDNDIRNYGSGTKGKAEALLSEMRRQAPTGAKVAVVSWLGYDTPDISPAGVIVGAESDAAKHGAKTLGRDLAFINEVNPYARLTVVGHSYGSVVIGQAMRKGLDADAAVVAGSPGMDADDRRELGSKNVALWATRNRRLRLPKLEIPLDAKTAKKDLSELVHTVLPTDVIPMLPSHGEDPAAPGFHANRFRSGGVASHGDYLNPGTESIANIAKIAVGKQPTR